MTISITPRALILAFILATFSIGYTYAHNKVVVVPLGGDDPEQAIYYASVNSAGDMTAGNIVSSTRSFNGVYTIALGRSTIGCAATVTRGNQGGGVTNAAGESLANIATNSVTVRLRSDRTNSFEGINSDFHVVIVCPV